MANYAVNNQLGGTQQNLSSAYKTLVEIHAVTATLKRAMLFEFEIGIDGTPNGTDCSLNWDISRTTAAGTAGATPPPLPLDPADAASGIACGINHPTVEPTYTVASSLWALGANQRASYRWISRDDKSALWIPATNLAGLGLRVKSATYNSTAIAQLYYQDQ